MSSLRVESLRLCWLEAFIAVNDAENISEAARNLGLSQSTVSRYVQNLEAWTGKKLIEINRMKDPEDPGVNVGSTPDGHRFYDIATAILDQLNDFRADKVRSKEKLDEMRSIVRKMRADLESTAPTQTVLEIQENIATQSELVATLDERVPLDNLETLARALRRFFAQYEFKKELEIRQKGKAKSSRKRRSTS